MGSSMEARRRAAAAAASPAPRFLAIPGHPYASYRKYTDSVGRLIIECQCSACGPSGLFKKHCRQPARSDETILRYGMIHGHGLSPRRVR